MTIRTLAICTVAFCIPLKANAQEAFMTQISTQIGTITTSAQRVGLDASAIISSLEIPVRAPVGLSPDISGFRVIGPAGGSAIARTSVTGNDNSATIMQSGIHAASLSQTGNFNSGQIFQAGVGNQASIYQRANGNIASVMQNGSGNIALTVQR